MIDQNNRNIETTSSSVSDGKVTAIISYLTLIGLIIAFFINLSKKNAFASFHIRQMLGLVITEIILEIIDRIIPVLGPIIFIIGTIVMIIFGLWALPVLSTERKR